MQDKTPRPAQEQPWENGWVPDTSRAPGTRRLWLAGGLAMATIIACAASVALMDRAPDKLSAAGSPSPSGEATAPGLISFATASTTGTASPGTKMASPSPSGRSTSAAPRPQASTSPSPVRTSKSPSGHASSSRPKPQATTRSVQSVNYPDRFWHVSGGLVKLDPVGGSESREDSTFTLVNGLAKSSCYSFVADDGGYLRHRDFVLRSERYDGSTLFRQDATFCAVSSASFPGAVMLESVNYPGRFLRHQNFGLRLDPYGYNTTNRPDFSFRLVGGLG
ncbi:AbfB domain-containing protein [Streptomyces sp. NPDC087903]|uniref:AbfB domain-containing protein n=1 Tax=Streptomyces sp. NPDC087903 TaxID=3365819 RepID=UPI0037F9BE44